MRLTGLTLSNYGNFKSERIDFAAAPGTINILMAPNGGGKSVLRSAFCDLLFGIGVQSPMGFRYGYSGMRIMADAIDSDGASFSFGRRKGQGNTLIDADGAALDPATIARRLGSVDRAGLERLFALDTERLRLGQAELLASDGEFANALLSGAGGARDLRALSRRLMEGRDGLAPTRRSASRPFYVAVDAFVAARKRKDASLLRPDRWKKTQAELAEVQARQDEQNRIVQAESANIARMERVRRVRPALAALDAAAGWLAANRDAPVLSAGLKDRLDLTRSEIVIAEQRLAREQAQAAQLARQLAELVVDDRLLAEAEEIDRLIGSAGAARKSRADSAAVAAQAEARRLAVVQGLRELGSALSTERAQEAVPARAAVTRVRHLIKDHAVRREALQAAAAQMVRTEQERGQVVVDQTGDGAPEDVSALEALVKEIRTDGDPARRLREAGAVHQKAEAELASCLARTPGWTEGAAALMRLAVQPVETYQRHADGLETVREEAERRGRDVQAATKVRDEALARLTALTAGGPLADEAALKAARNRREAGWQLIYRRAFLGDPPVAEEEQAFTDGQPMPLVYEAAVRAADAIADQRMDNADAAARVDAAKTALGDAETALAAAAAVYQGASAAVRAEEAVWDEACGTLPIAGAASLKEVLAFIAARDRVIEAQHGLTVAEEGLGALRQAHAAWAGRLASLLGEDGGTPVATLLAGAELRLDAARKANERRAAVRARLEGADKALAQARHGRTQAEAALSEWQGQWAEALTGLRRPAGEAPAVTEEFLQVLEDLGKAHTDHVALRERVAGMERDVARFTAEAVALALRIAPDLDPSDAFALMAPLRQRLQQAKEAAGQRDLLRKQADDATAAADIARRMLADRRDEQQSVLALIGATTIEDAEARLLLAAERAAHATRLGEAEARLADAGDGLPMEALREEAAAVAADDIARLIEESDQRRQAAQQSAQEAAARAAALTQEMAREQDATAAVDAAADQQAAVARLGRVLDEALLYHLAVGMLDAALAAVEKDSEPEMLRKISALFSTLTGGVYARVMTETDDSDATRLSLMQRDYPDERQAVGDLSEGTRDQLYLALRLAAIEMHVTASPALPFIGDDILQTFDNARAVAALRVLREVSQSVQVILLTHHRHVLDLAGQLPADAVHICRVGMSLEAA